MIFKHATEADWKLSSYVADEGEQIIYDPDELHANPRIKIGDGQKIADELPFTTAEVPTKISEFENDAGYLKTESDPTVPSWAKSETKPSYTKAEIGLGNVDNVKQYSESNPPPYPVTSVNGTIGAITIKVPTKVSELTNDSGFITASQAPETFDEIYVGDGDMPETATIQLIMDGMQIMKIR